MCSTVHAGLLTLELWNVEENMWCIGASGLRATNANMELSFTVYWLTVSHFFPAHHIGKTSQLTLAVHAEAKANTKQEKYRTQHS